jgi:ADP-ribose pyrophosphatase YjhB (NUDIX family)
MAKDLHLITATAIIVKGGKYLILKRAPHEKVYPNKWTVPGGKLKFDDYMNSPKATKDGWYFVVDKFLRREIKEECNLEVGELKYLLDLIFIRPDDIHVLTLSYFAEYKSGEVKLEEDFTEYFWGTVEELKSYDLIEGIYDEIKMVDEILSGKKAEVEFLK